MENRLGIYINDLSYEKGELDEDLKNAFDTSFDNADKDTGLPELKDLESDSIQDQDWAKVHGKYLHIMRNTLTGHFQCLDKSLRHSVQEMKKNIAEMLQEAGLENLAPEDSGKDFLEELLNELNKDNNNNFPELKQGLNDLIDFQLLFRGLFQHRLRESLGNLYPDLTEYKIPANDRSNLTAESVRDLLLNAYEDTLYLVKKELEPLLREPGMARHAIVEEFRDRIWKASNSEEQWRIFLDERKDRLWPEQFKWQKLLAQTEKTLPSIIIV